jgi:putative flippase GtrA
VTAMALADVSRGLLLRFTLVGVGAALLLFSLSYLFVEAGLPPFPASALAYGIAFAAAYTGQRNWTFGSGHPHRSALPRYLAVQLACGGLAGFVSHVSVTRLGMPPLAMAAATTVLASAASFLATSLWVFPRR